MSKRHYESESSRSKRFNRERRVALKRDSKIAEKHARGAAKRGTNGATPAARDVASSSSIPLVPFEQGSSSPRVERRLDQSQALADLSVTSGSGTQVLATAPELAEAGALADVRRDLEDLTAGPPQPAQQAQKPLQ